jgi:predicted RNA-binding Zn-ribbon protein involved in translation (DUF1610 family)
MVARQLKSFPNRATAMFYCPECGEAWTKTQEKNNRYRYPECNRGLTGPSRKDEGELIFFTVKSNARLIVRVCK